MQWKIVGRTLQEFYKDADSLKNNHTYTIYFADTLVNKYGAKDLDELTLNATSTSGRYFVAASTLYNEALCYQINGFGLSNSIITLTVSDTWAQFLPVIFKKVQ